MHHLYNHLRLPKAKHTDLLVRNVHLKRLLTSFSFSSSHSLADFAFVIVSIVVKVWNEKCNDKQWHNLNRLKCSWCWNKLLAVGFLLLGQIAMYPHKMHSQCQKTSLGKKGLGWDKLNFHALHTLFSLLSCPVLPEVFILKWKTDYILSSLS